MYYLKLVKMPFMNKAIFRLSELLAFIIFVNIKVDGVFQNLLKTYFCLSFLKWLKISKSHGSNVTNAYRAGCSHGIHVQSVNGDCDILILLKFYENYLANQPNIILVFQLVIIKKKCDHLYIFCFRICFRAISV